MRSWIFETYKARFQEIGFRLLSPLVVLIFWEILVRAGVLDYRFFPPPSRVLETLIQLFLNGEMVNHTIASLQRLIFGFLIGSTLGLILGLAIGWSQIIEKLIDPLIAVFYPIPKLALLPLILIIFGLGEESKIAIVSIGVFFTVVINTAAAVKGIEPVYIDAARNFGANGMKMFRKVVIPAALPGIFTGLRLGLGFGLIVIVAAEFVASKEGLGFLVWLSWGTLSTTKMYAGLVMIGILGITTTYLLQWLSIVLMPWNQGREQAHSHKGQTSRNKKSILIQKLRHVPTIFGEVTRQYLYEVPNTLTLPTPGNPGEEISFAWISTQNVSAIQPWKGKQGVKLFRQKLNQGMVGIYSMCDERVVGYIWAFIYTQASPSIRHFPIQPGDGFIESAEVHPDHMRRGVDSRQRYILINRLRESHPGGLLRKICGTFRIENTPILKVIERQGAIRKKEFIQIRTTPWIYFRWCWELDESGKKTTKFGHFSAKFKVPDFFFTTKAHQLFGKFLFSTTGLWQPQGEP